MIPKTSDLNELMPGAERFYHAWLLLHILWRGMWNFSRTDWSSYRLRAWSIFESWVRTAVRTGSGLTGFLSVIAPGLGLEVVGGNEAERQAVVGLLALPEAEQRRILFQLRNELPVLMLLLRNWRDQKRAEREEEQLDLFDESEEDDETAHD